MLRKILAVFGWQNWKLGKERENPESRDRNRRWMMMNDYDYDGSSLPPKLSGPGMDPKICSHYLARAREELTTCSRIRSIGRLTGNSSTFKKGTLKIIIIIIVVVVVVVVVVVIIIIIISSIIIIISSSSQKNRRKRKRLQTHPPGPGPEGNWHPHRPHPSYSNLLGFDIMQRYAKKYNHPVFKQRNSSWVNPAFMKKLIRACLPTTSDTNLEKLHYALLHVHSTCTANKSSCLHVPPNKGMKNGRAQDTLMYMMFRRRSEMSPRNSLT